MSLKPSLRPNKRYIAFRLEEKAYYDAKEISKSIIEAYSKLNKDCSKTGLRLLSHEFNKNKQIGIIVINREYLNKLKESLEHRGIKMKQMSNQMMGYDRTQSMFSPDGRLLQIEYAKKTVRQGTTALGMVCK